MHIVLYWKFPNGVEPYQRPMDNQFKEDFETLSNETDEGFDLIIPDSGTQVPILDEDISPAEIDSHIKGLKANKSPRVDSLPPGIL